MISFGDFLLDGLIIAAFIGGTIRYFYNKLDTSGEIQEAAKQKAKSKILDWFK